MNNDLNKSIDAILDEVFAEDETIEKSIDIADDAKTTADEVVKKAPKGKDDSKNPDRPKQISDVPNVDTDGKRSKDYDKDITANKGKEDENPEAKKQVKEKNQIKKSESDDLEKSERDELEAFRAEKVARETELRKAEAIQVQEDLIKSVVEKTAARYEAKIEAMQNTIDETNTLTKSMANKPQRVKSITNIQSLEKGENMQKSNTFTKDEMLDAAEELVKSGDLYDTDVIELENCGTLNDPIAKAKLVKKLQG